MLPRQRARRNRQAMVERIGQLMSKSCRILACGKLGVGRDLPHRRLLSSAARVARKAARAVCRLPFSEAGCRLTCLIVEFPAHVLSFSVGPTGAFAAPNMARKKSSRAM